MSFLNTLAQKYKVTSGLADWKSAKTKFLNESGCQSDVDDYLARFKKLCDAAKIKNVADRNIDEWTKRGWLEFVSFVDKTEGTSSNTELRKLQKTAGAEKVAENDKWTVYRIKTYEAAQLYGAGTCWCVVTRSKDDAQEWFERIDTEPLYFIISKTLPKENKWYKIALAVYKDDEGKWCKEYFDATDNGFGVLDDQYKIKRLPKNLDVPEFEIKKG